MGTGPGRRRRQVLATSGSLLAGLALTGCQGTTGRPTGTATGRTRTDAVNADLRAELGLPDPTYSYADSLRIFQWENYWPSRTITEFEQAYGVTSVTVDTYTANEAIPAALRQEGLDAYDLVFPSDWMVTALVDDGLLAPVDTDRLHNWSNLDSRWVEQAPYDTGPQRHSVPYQWGTTGIAWNTQVIQPEGIDSWDALWNPAWRGQITMLDNKRETIGAALQRLGYSLNTRDESEIEEATETLLQQRDLVLEYDSGDMPSNLADGRASPVHTWSGEAFIAYDQLRSGSGTSPINYTVPEEGGVVWIDTATIPAEAPHPNTAHLFIDYLLSARVGAAITDFNKYATPNRAAREYVDPELLANDLVFPPEETRERLEFIRDVGDASAYYVDAWDEIRSV